MGTKVYTQADFDRITERQGTDSIKWDGRERVFGNKDVVPLWVADMDFETPEFIRERIAKRLEHPVLGYTYRSDAFFQSFVDWVKRRHDWEIDRKWVTFTPGVVAAVSAAVMAFTEPGDEVIVQPPVYFPFFKCVEGLGRKLVYNQLNLENGRLNMDFNRLREQITPSTRMIILSSPHNPGGSVWTPEELSELAGICKDHQLWIVSDEIHSDLVFKPFRHTPIAMAAPDYLHRMIITMAPSKTFNLAALSTSVAVIPDETARHKYEDLIHTLHIGMGNVFGAEGLQAAYEEGWQWLEQLMEYLAGNLHFLAGFINSEIPGIRMIKPEATYLAWLDFRDLGMQPDNLNRFIIEKAGIGMNPGTQFGPGGEGFMRLNFGCPRKILEPAMVQLKQAVETLTVKRES